jgi:glycosyltransferase involved in cell wall biosynthesis
LITGTIITRNEEDRIAAAIASLSCCDEVIVVDSGSTDRTREIAEQCGARVFVRDWDGYSPQKNFAAQKSSHDWILSLDADERVSIELANEIAAWTPAANESARSMPRRAFYLGSWIRHSGWYPDRKIRLYDRRRTRWVGDFVHEKLDINDGVGSFRGELLHFPYRNWQDHLRRIDRYTELAANGALASGKKGSILRLFFGPPIAFFQTLLLRLGILDGRRGWVIGFAAARYVFLRQSRILRGRWFFSSVL